MCTYIYIYIYLKIFSKKLGFFNLSRFLCEVGHTQSTCYLGHGAEKAGLQGSVCEVVRISQAACGSLASPKSPASLS